MARNTTEEKLCKMQLIGHIFHTFPFGFSSIYSVFGCGCITATHLTKIEMLMSNVTFINWVTSEKWTRTNKRENICWYNFVDVLFQKWKKERKINTKIFFFQTWKMNEMRMKRADRNYWSDDSHSWKTLKLRRFNSVVYSHSSIRSFRPCDGNICIMCDWRFVRWIQPITFVHLPTHTYTHARTHKFAKERWKKYKKKIMVIFLGKMFDSLWLKMTAWVTRHTTNNIIFFWGWMEFDVLYL